MKHFIFSLTMISLIVISNAQQLSDNVSKAEELIKNGFPKDAATMLEKEFPNLSCAENTPLFVKAHILYITALSRYEEDVIQRSVKHLEETLSQCNEPAGQIFHSYLGELYLRYGGYNAGEKNFIVSENDIATWSFQQIREKALYHFEASMKNPQKLFQIPVTDYDILMTKNAENGKYRPTLYDIMAHRFINNCSDKPLPSAYTELTAKMPDFLSLKWKNEGVLFERLGVTTFQELLRLHGKDNDPSALVQADLDRIAFFGGNTSKGIPAYDYLLSTYANHEAVALAAFAKATVLNNQAGAENKMSRVEAANICKTYSEKFPHSDGGKNCAVFLQEITQQKLQSVTIESVVLPSKPSLAYVEFRNIARLNVRLYKIPSEDIFTFLKNDYRRGADFKNFIAETTPVQEWSVAFPDTKDYLLHTTEIEIPALKESGAYCLIATRENEFSFEESEFISQVFQVSSIHAAFIRETGENGFFLITDRWSGSPLKNASVHIYKTNSAAVEQTLITNEKGMVALPESFKSSVQVSFSAKNDVLYAMNNIWTSGSSSVTRKNIFRTNIFTDRAIYRPGQSVYFKGILTEISETKVAPVSGKEIEVSIRDANYQEVTLQKLKTDDFGGFDGSFVIPSSVLTGTMTIKTPHGTGYFLVEEYKRPRFEVIFDKLQNEYRLNEEIRVSGKAVMLNGLPLENATVNYEITRYAFRPLWRFYSYYSASETIDKGTVTTKADGSFEIVFKTTADTEDTDRSYYYNFAVSADVVDITGETQNGITSFGVGSNSVRINLNLPALVVKDENDLLEYSFLNFEGEKLPVSGEITIEELMQPKTSYIQRYWDIPDTKVIPEEIFRKKFPQYQYEIDSLPVSKTIYSRRIENKSSDSFNLSEKISASGAYRVTIQTTDKTGRTVKRISDFNYIKPDEKAFPLMENAVLYLNESSVAIGEILNIYLGSAAKNAQVFYMYSDINGKSKQEWLAVGKKTTRITIPIDASLRAGFTVLLQIVQENRAYTLQQRIGVTDPAEKLQINVTGIRDKTLPGSKERWQVKISDKDGKPVPATLFTTMYDAALDKFQPLRWNFSITPNFRLASLSVNTLIGNTSYGNQYNMDKTQYSYTVPSYRNLNWFGYNFYAARRFGGDFPIMHMEASPAAKGEADLNASSDEIADDMEQEISAVMAPPQEAQIRQNFSETAFFYPDLRTDKDGNIILEFTMPDALTRWNMKAIGYSKTLQIGSFEQTIVTESDFMVMPNLPRYLRAGDQCAFTTRIANKTDKQLSGTAKIVIENVANGQSMSENIIGNIEIPFTVKGNESITVSWNYRQPDYAEALMIRITATSGNFTDGEEHMIPVLPSEMVALESIPIEISKAGTHTYSFKNFTNVDAVQKLTFEMATSPVWYAIQSLPVLSSYPNESSDQIFNRYYAAALGSYVLNSMPQIKRVFDQWRHLEPDAFLSNLEKNQELKTVLLSETPWVMDAQNETARKQRLATLFDINKLSYSQQQAVAKLRQQMLDNGAFPWFPNMNESVYITRYIVTGIGKLNALGLKNSDLDFVANQAIGYLDQKWLERYEKAIKEHKKYTASGSDIEYFYARSFFPDKKYTGEQAQAVAAVMGDLVKDQTKFDFNSRANLALTLQRNGRAFDAQTIAKSLDNYSIGNAATGKYWRSQQGNLTASGIALSTLMIEVYNEILKDKTASNDVITWLLRNKRTNDWLTPIATADAVYALVSSSDKMLEPAQVSVKIGQNSISSESQKQEAGTGYFKVVYDKGAIESEMKNITVVTAEDKQVWGGAYLQYRTSLDKIKGDKNAPLTVSREIFKQEGGEWVKISDNAKLQVGDRITVRLILKADRDFEYVHVRDMRAAAFEPVEQLSGYIWGQLGYYRSVRDASVDLFFNRVSRGTWSVEYELFVTQKGIFSNGFSTIQCMYAPEFSGNSDGVKVIIE